MSLFRESRKEHEKIQTIILKKLRDDIVVIIYVESYGFARTGDTRWAIKGMKAGLCNNSPAEVFGRAGRIKSVYPWTEACNRNKNRRFFCNKKGIHASIYSGRQRKEGKRGVNG